MNVIARLGYELAYHDSALRHFNHYSTRTPPINIWTVPEIWKDSLCTRNNPRERWNEGGGTENQRKNWDHSDQNTGKISKDTRCHSEFRNKKYEKLKKSKIYEKICRYPEFSGKITGSNSYEIVAYNNNNNNLRINFYLLRTFCPHLGSFCVVSSFTTFRPNFTSGLLQVIYHDLG